jgi:hypothetical protein
MKHLGKVTVARSVIHYREPGFADAKSDFMNAIWKAWQDFVVQKKNEVNVA